jgi:hypothetical protein
MRGTYVRRITTSYVYNYVCTDYLTSHRLYVCTGIVLYLSVATGNDVPCMGDLSLSPCGNDLDVKEISETVISELSRSFSHNGPYYRYKVINDQHVSG